MLRNHAHCILKTLHVAHPKYCFRKYLRFCCFFLNDDSESTAKTMLVLLSRMIINKLPLQLQISSCTSSDLMEGQS